MTWADNLAPPGTRSAPGGRRRELGFSAAPALEASEESRPRYEPAIGLASPYRRDANGVRRAPRDCFVAKLDFERCGACVRDRALGFRRVADHRVGRAIARVAGGRNAR